MRHLSSLFCAAILMVMVATTHLNAGDIKVIVNSSVGASSATAAEIKAVFLQAKTSLSDGSHVQPVILTGPEYGPFVQGYLGKTVTALETYYRSLLFSGTGVIPKFLASEQEMVNYVTKTKGAIGYVSAKANTGGVKVLNLN